MIEQEYFLTDEAETVAIGQSFAVELRAGMTLFIEGALGAGKTTFCRGILNYFGHRGTVKSPTYTLVESYEQLIIPVYHFDLYRLSHGEELEYIGIRDYFSDTSLCLVEWAERAESYLPKPDVTINIVPAIDSGKHGRRLSIKRQ